MKNILMGLLLSMSIIACKSKRSPTPIESKTDTIEVVADTAHVADSLEQAQAEKEERASVARAYAENLGKEYAKEQAINDSISTVIVKLDFQLTQYKENQKKAKDFTTQAINKKLSNAWLKQRMIETINKPVKKYVGADVETKIDTVNLESADSEIIRLKDGIVSIKSQRPELIEQTKKKSAELLHKKMIHTNAQFYLNITIKNSSQDKFLKGWMRRALSQ